MTRSSGTTSTAWRLIYRRRRRCRIRVRARPSCAARHRRRTLKVLFAIKGLNTAGGAERVICDVTSYLADSRGHDISLLTFDGEDQEPFYPVSRAVQQIRLGIGDTRSSTSLPILLRRVWALRRAVLLHAPDVVVAFMHSMFVP